MTISLGKHNQTPSLVKTRFNSLTNSVSSFGLASIAIALLSVFSGNPILDKAATIFLVGSMVQTNVESKKRHEKAQTGLMIMDSQQVRLQRNVEDLEANLTVNNQRVSSAFSQLSLVTDSQKQLFAQLDSISHSVEAQLQLVVSKINELEAESNNSVLLQKLEVSP
jgi:flagellar biosynthesis component FlhA